MDRATSLQWRLGDLNFKFPPKGEMFQESCPRLQLLLELLASHFQHFISCEHSDQNF